MSVKQVVSGVRATTPANSQRASRSPTPAHELFGGGSGDRNAQSQPRYPLPMYQGVHIVQGNVFKNIQYMLKTYIFCWIVSQIN